MMTGNTNLADLGKVVSWNGLKKLVTWSNDNANTIKGTYGAISTPFKTRNTGYYTFIPDMCRSLRFDYSRDNAINTVDTFDFTLPKDTFYNSNPEYREFCEKDCIGGGIFNNKDCLKRKLDVFSIVFFMLVSKNVDYQSNLANFKFENSIA